MGTVQFYLYVRLLKLEHKAKMPKYVCFVLI